MTHRDIYNKFMVEYDKANITSSYPSLTEYEIASILDKAYLALIARKVTGNNARRVSFEGDLKTLEDLQPLVKTKTIKKFTTPQTSVLNAINYEVPNDLLYYVSSSMRCTGKIGTRTLNVKQIDHSIAKNFFTTAYNMPWIKDPVCYFEDNYVTVLYDIFMFNEQPSRYVKDHTNLDLTYIKYPKAFLLENNRFDTHTIEEPEDDSEDTWEIQVSYPEMVYNRQNRTTISAFTENIDTGEKSYDVQFTIDANEYAYIDGNTLIVKPAAVDEETVTITATSEEHEVSTTFDVVVKYFKAQWTVVFDSPSYRIYNNFNKQQISATAKDDDNNASSNIIYSITSGGQYATITSSGVLTVTAQDNIVHTVTIRGTFIDDPSVYSEVTASVRFYIVYTMRDIQGLNSIYNEQNTSIYTVVCTNNRGESAGVQWYIRQGDGQFVQITENNNSCAVDVLNSASNFNTIILRATCSYDSSVYKEKTIQVKYYTSGGSDTPEEPEEPEEWSVVFDTPSQLVYNENNYLKIQAHAESNKGNTGIVAFSLAGDNDFRYAGILWDGSLYVYSKDDETHSVTVKAEYVPDGANRPDSDVFATRVFYVQRYVNWTMSDISGDDYVYNENNSSTYTCTMSGGSSTKRVSWQIIQGSQFASINARGVLSVSSSAINDQEVTIRAYCTVNDVQYQQTKTITVKYYTSIERVWDIQLSDVPDTIDNGQNSYQCIVVANDNYGNSSYVIYEIIQGQQYASINDSGLITVNNVDKNYHEIRVKFTCGQDRNVYVTKNISVRYNFVYTIINNLPKEISGPLQYTIYRKTNTIDLNSTTEGIVCEDSNGQRIPLSFELSGEDVIHVTLENGILTILSTAQEPVKIMTLTIIVPGADDNIIINGETSITIGVKYYKLDPDIWWNVTQSTITEESQLQNVTIFNPDNLPLTFYSTNTDILTVDQYGNISYANKNKDGGCIIYAEFKGNDQYKAVKRGCALLVNIYSEHRAQSFIPVGIDADDKFFNGTDNSSRQIIWRLEGGTSLAVVDDRVFKTPLWFTLQSDHPNELNKYSFHSIDGFGAIIQYYSSWFGGTSDAARQSLLSVYNVNRLDDLCKSISFVSVIDENNKILIKGGYTTRVIKLPYSGTENRNGTFYSRYLHIEKFPTSFYQYTYITPLYAYYINYRNGTRVLVSDRISGGEGIICKFEKHNESSLDTKIEYQIRKNTSETYKDEYIQIAINPYSNRPWLTGNESVGYHFIQEYQAENRIYYGKDLRQRSMTYIDINNDQLNNDGMFSFLNSYILDDNSYTITAGSSDESSFLVLYQPSIVGNSIGKYNLTYTSGLTCDETSSYTWGWDVYTVLHFTKQDPYSSERITFKKIIE